MKLSSKTSLLIILTMIFTPLFLFKKESKELIINTQEKVNIETKKQENTVYNEDYGLIFQIPEGFESADNSTFVCGDATLFVLCDTKRFYTSDYDVYCHFIRQKETLKIPYKGKPTHVSLYNFTGGLAPVTMEEDRTAFLEIGDVFLKGGEYTTLTYLNFCLSGRGIVAGLIGQDNLNLLYDFIKNIQEVTYSGSKNPDKLPLKREYTFGGRTFHLPESFTEERISDSVVMFSPAPSSYDPFYGSKILLVRSDKNDLPDGIYSQKDVKAALGAEKIDVIITEDHEDLSLKAEDGKIDYIAKHTVVSDDLHLILFGIENVSYGSIAALERRILEE